MHRFVGDATKRYVSHDEELLTSAEVATAYRVTTTTVRRWVAAGELEAIRLPGGRLRFRRADVERIAQPVAADGAAPSSGAAS